MQQSVIPLNQTPDAMLLLPEARAETTGTSLNPALIVDGVRRHFWIPLTLAMFGMIVGYSYYKRQKPGYEATSVAQFGAEQKTLLGIDGVGSSHFGDEKSVNTLIQAAKSRDVMGRVVTDLKLTQRTAFSGGHPAESKEAKDQAIAVVGSMTRVSLRKDTRLIDFTVSGADPDLVAAISSQAALSLVTELESQKNRTLQEAVQSLVAEGERLQEKLKKSEIAMHDYKRKNQAISLDERKDLVLSKLKELGAELNRQSTERLTLETHLQACKEGNLPRDQLLNLPTIANHPKISGILSQIGAQKAAMAVLSERYKPKHPKYEAAQAQYDNLELQLNTLLGDAVGLLKSSCENSQELERKMQAQLKQQESEALDLEQLAVQYNVLKREMESDQAVYESVLSRIKQVDVSKEMEAPPIWVHQLAMVPSEPVSPNAQKIVGSSTAGGAMLGLAIIGLIVMQDRSIRSLEDAREKLRMPVLGIVTNIAQEPESSGRTKNAAVRAEMVLKSHKNIAENFRELRAVVTKHARNQKQCFMVVSAVPEEGKTFVSTHLAVTFASQGLRTLMVDLDLRRSRLAETFGISKRGNGLTELALGEATLADVCHDTGIPNLFLLPAGRHVSNPAELLANCDIKQLRKVALEAGFDRIVIDTAPLIPVHDTLVLGELADITLMVVRCNRTPSVIVQEAMRKLQQTGIPLSGVVLNRLNRRSRSYDYYYHNSYYRPKEIENEADTRPPVRHAPFQQEKIINS
jgi:succinoglycan biosynthesis transport protein ExoP